nr:hypothetical protein [Spirochaetales bacterium]
GQYLSTGTRDAFFLAARLTLARRSAPSGGRAIIVLDEPFLTLDKNRTENALRVLKEFHETTGWQIFLFTKEEELAEQVRSFFGERAQVIRLD